MSSEIPQYTMFRLSYIPVKDSDPNTMKSVACATLFPCVMRLHHMIWTGNLTAHVNNLLGVCWLLFSLPLQVSNSHLYMQEEFRKYHILITFLTRWLMSALQGPRPSPLNSALKHTFMFRLTRAVKDSSDATDQQQFVSVSFFTLMCWKSGIISTNWIMTAYILD